MLVTWNPEDGSETKTWDFDPDDVRYSKIRQIETHYGGTWDSFKIGLMSGEMKARGVLLWHMMTQVHPKLAFKDLPDFFARQLKVDMGSRELIALKKRVDKMRGLPDEQRVQFEAQFDADLHEALQREGVDPDSAEAQQLAIEGDAIPKPA